MHFLWNTEPAALYDLPRISCGQKSTRSHFRHWSATPHRVMTQSYLVANEAVRNLRRAIGVVGLPKKYVPQDV
jgi:hypothetical protein